eukprot:COSAG06_NODE_3203_length_5690_cov_1.769272_3_plen_216_part_00
MRLVPRLRAAPIYSTSERSAHSPRRNKPRTRCSRVCDTQVTPSQTALVADASCDPCMRAYMCVCFGYAARALLDLLLMSRWDSLALVGDLDMPVLFLAGEDDEVVPHEQMLQLHHEHRDHAARGGSSSSNSDGLFGKKGQGSGDSHLASETSAASSGGVCAADAGSGQRRQQQQSTLVTFPGGRHNETWMLDDYYSHIESWLDSFPALQQHPPAS